MLVRGAKLHDRDISRPGTVQLIRRVENDVMIWQLAILCASIDPAYDGSANLIFLRALMPDIGWSWWVCIKTSQSCSPPHNLCLMSSISQAIIKNNLAAVKKIWNISLISNFIPVGSHFDCKVYDWLIVECMSVSAIQITATICSLVSVVGISAFAVSAVVCNVGIFSFFSFYADWYFLNN
jgi:hypothetical protein